MTNGAELVNTYAAAYDDNAQRALVAGTGGTGTDSTAPLVARPEEPSPAR